MRYPSQGLSGLFHPNVVYRIQRARWLHDVSIVWPGRFRFRLQPAARRLTTTDFSASSRCATSTPNVFSAVFPRARALKAEALRAHSKVMTAALASPWHPSHDPCVSKRPLRSRARPSHDVSIVRPELRPSIVLPRRVRRSARCHRSVTEGGQELPPTG
jgi:hypothetical protein